MGASLGSGTDLNRFITVIERDVDHGCEFETTTTESLSGRHPESRSEISVRENPSANGLHIRGPNSNPAEEYLRHVQIVIGLEQLAALMSPCAREIRDRQRYAADDHLAKREREVNFITQRAA